MSRVYFHSPSGTAELRGSERAYAGCLINDIALAVLKPNYWNEKKLREMLPEGHYLKIGGNERFIESWSTAFSVNSGDLIVHKDQCIDSWTISLNTAMALGNDVMRFLARLHGQCEIHGYVEGPNRLWLANIIWRGLQSGLYRPEMGWDRVGAILRLRDDEPVVMSYSVCQSFPNYDIAGWAKDDEGDGFYELTKYEQWHLAMTNLRAQDRGLELKPDNYEAYRFGHCITAFDVVAEMSQQEVAS
jgi:hypothetical protein